MPVRACFCVTPWRWAVLEWGNDGTFHAALTMSLIDRLFQPLADWMDRHMALGPYRAARRCLDLASLAWICAEAERWPRPWPAMMSASAAARGLLVVLGLWAFTILRGVFRKADGGQARARPPRPIRCVRGCSCIASSASFWMVGLAVKAFAGRAALKRWRFWGGRVRDGGRLFRRLQQSAARMARSARSWPGPGHGGRRPLISPAARPGRPAPKFDSQGLRA